MIARDREGVPTARVERLLPLDAEEAWELVADARHHTRWVPLTRVALGPAGGGTPSWSARADGDLPRVGDVIQAVSGPFARRGAPGLVDRMRIERFEPPLGAVPGVAVFVKLGPVLLGSARIEVEGVGPRSSRVTWTEGIHLRGLPRAATAWAGAIGVQAMLVLTLGRASREAVRLAAQRPDA